MEQPAPLESPSIGPGGKSIFLLALHAAEKANPTDGADDLETTSVDSPKQDNLNHEQDESKAVSPEKPSKKPSTLHNQPGFDSHLKRLSHRDKAPTGECLPQRSAIVGEFFTDHSKDAGTHDKGGKAAMATSKGGNRFGSNWKRCSPFPAPPEEVQELCAKEMSQQLWREMKSRVKVEQDTIRKEQAGMAHLFQNEPVQSSSDQPLVHLRMSLDARLERLSNLDSELCFLGTHGADINSQQILKPEVVASLKRAPERPSIAKARFSLKLPSLMDDGDQGAPSPGRVPTESSLLAKQLQVARAAHEKREAESQQLAVAEEANLEIVDMQDLVEEQCLPRVGKRKTMLPFMVDLREGLGLPTGKTGLFAKRASQVDVSNSASVPPGVAATEHAVVPKRMAGSMLDAAKQQEVDKACGSPRQERVSMKGTSSTNMQHQRGSPKTKRWSMATHVEPHEHHSFDEHLLRFQRRTKGPQPSHLHVVIKEAIALLKAVCEELESLMANSSYCRLRHCFLYANQSRHRANLIKGVCKHLHVLERFCKDLAKHASGLTYVITLAQKMSQEECKQLTKARVASINRPPTPDPDASTMHLPSAESPRSQRAREGVDHQDWLEIFDQMRTRFVWLDDLASTSLSEGRNAIENVRLVQERLEPLLTDEVLDGSFAQELANMSLAICLQDEFDELNIVLVESLCQIFCGMARAALLPPQEVPKSIGDSLFKPKSHLHSGAKVRWNNLPERVVTWAMACPPVPDRVMSREAPRPNVQAKSEKTFMRRGVSGWTCVQVTG